MSVCHERTFLINSARCLSAMPIIYRFLVDIQRYFENLFAKSKLVEIFDRTSNYTMTSLSSLSPSKLIEIDIIFTIIYYTTFKTGYKCKFPRYYIRIISKSVIHFI